MREVTRILKRLKRDETVSYFSFTIEASGSVNGDAKIEYKLYTNDQEFIKGNSVDALVDEMLRRRGWTSHNKPLMLTANEQQRSDADRTYTNAPEEPF